MSADERVGTVGRERLAADLAVRAGRLALEHFHRAQVARRSSDAVVTNADVAIRERLATEIARAFPDDAVVGTEEPPDDERRQALYSWVLDPVDGNDDFERGLPGFAMSIGVLRDRRPFAGAVYDPLTRWLFTACAGRGAWVNERPLRARPAPLSHASLVSIWTPVEEGVAGHVERWLQRYRVRRFGSTALHLCYVALGALDLVYDPRASIRDIAGAAPVLMEAGGVLSAADGSPLFPVTPARMAGAPLTFLAGNRVSHAQGLADIVALSTVGG
jgi:myo-inositol-1(or 4)-monophosphatase